MRVNHDLSGLNLGLELERGYEPSMPVLSETYFTGVTLHSTRVAYNFFRVAHHILGVNHLFFRVEYRVRVRGRGSVGAWPSTQPQPRSQPGKGENLLKN